MAKPERGQIIRLDFEAWTEDGDLFDTTRSEVAEEAGWTKDTATGPMPIVLGSGRILPGLEEAILEAEVGDDVEVTIPPEKAFGVRDPDAERLFPMREFAKREIEPEPGARVEVGGRRGTITRVHASRVKVDFNHPYAGLTLNYKFRIENILDDAEAQVNALLELALGNDHEVEASVDGDTVTITPPAQLAFDPSWFVAKHRLAHDLLDNTDLENIVFTETITEEDMEAHAHEHHGQGQGHDAEHAHNA